MEKSKQIKECEFCEKDANCLCLKCNQYFCDNCFKVIHNLTKYKEHKKDIIDAFVPIELKCQKHPTYLNNLFCINEKGKNKKLFNNIFINIEICCLMCHFRELHKGHKLVEITDEEKLKKENFSIEEEIKSYNGISQKLDGLKNKIEKEIDKLNQLFDKTIGEIKKSYQNKYEKLLKEENDLKENLQNKVTKTKEQLEIFLTEINENIRINERINKGIKKLENEKSMIHILSYISKINLSKKSVKKLSIELMKNITFVYEEEKSNIKYEEYFFNGVVVPKKIEFKDVGTTNLKISWNVDYMNIIDIEKNQIKYKVEMRKENNNDNFKEIYKGNDCNYSVNNLSGGITYEFRICSFYKNTFGEWSQIQKIKTFDSLILNESNREKEFLDKLYEWSGYKKMELLFRGTRDGMTAKDFHNKCDDKGPTITLFKNEKGYIFGGYASISWTCNDGNKSAPGSFLFTLTNIYNKQPTKFPSKIEGKEVYHSTNVNNKVKEKKPNF